MKLPKWITRRNLGLVALGAALALVGVGFTAISLEHSSSPAFCMSCHEMRVVAEQGWMHSAHYHNEGGVVAGCSDCHVPPEFAPKLWVKTRDGVKDVWTHFLGESDPAKMDWDHLAASARSKIHESACRKCHQNLTPQGMELKGLMAHRENERLDEPETCLECHVEEFHGRFRDMLASSGEETP